LNAESECIVLVAALDGAVLVDARVRKHGNLAVVNGRHEEVVHVWRQHLNDDTILATVPRNRFTHGFRWILAYAIIGAYTQKTLEMLCAVQ
jgi:hypothetical protein